MGHKHYQQKNNQKNSSDPKNPKKELKGSVNKYYGNKPEKKKTEKKQEDESEKITENSPPRENSKKRSGEAEAASEGSLLLKLSEDGATFRSYLNGTKITITPESSVSKSQIKNEELHQSESFLSFQRIFLFTFFGDFLFFVDSISKKNWR